FCVNASHPKVIVCDAARIEPVPNRRLSSSVGVQGGLMSLVISKIDKMNVFHGVSGAHAGTLQLIETRTSTGSTKSEWSWRGGPFGPQRGLFFWEDDGFPGMRLEAQTAKYVRYLSNDAWIGVKRPPMRPWFKLHDKIELVDPNFDSTPGRAHAFRCTLIS